MNQDSDAFSFVLITLKLEKKMNGTEEIMWKISGIYQKRKIDRNWFTFHLGQTYMKDKDVHHSWMNGSYCFVLTKHEHGKLYGGGKRC